MPKIIKKSASLQNIPTQPNLKQRLDDDGLPTVATTNKQDPSKLVSLIVAPPGYGKTEFYASAPDAIMLCCEEGHRFVTANKIIIDKWDFKDKEKPTQPWIDENQNTHMTFLQAVEALEESKRFSLIVIDTIDSLVKMILDHFYVAKKIEHADDLGGYGRGWDITQNTPFRRAFNRLLKTGRGIGMTTHQDISKKQFKSGEKSKKETSLPAGVWKVLFGQVDIIMHGVYGKRRNGSSQRDRLIVTEGSEEILAKNRGGVLPPEYICKRGKQWEQFAGFFTDPSSVDREYSIYKKAYGKDEED